MDIHVPACSTIQLSVLRQIKFILVHPSGNVQLAFRNCNIFSYPIGVFGNFKGNLSTPFHSNRKCISPKLHKSNHLVNCYNLFKRISLLALTSLYPIVMKMDFLDPAIMKIATLCSFYMQLSRLFSDSREISANCFGTFPTFP